MRHGVVFGGGEWGVDRETARVSFDPRRLAWICQMKKVQASRAAAKT